MSENVETTGSTFSRGSRFAVLLATFNGATYLPEQLASLRAQTVGHVDVIASDDGSKDDTPAILAAEAAGWDAGNFEVLEGPRQGFAENFRSLILRAEPTADYYAFCDQDDVWDSDKLEVAASRLESCRAPAVYCGSTRTITESGRQIGTSPLMRREPSFRNALVQSIAGGNTMVLNGLAFRLMQQACKDVHFVSHDWWTYLIVSGAGGVVIYDPEPRISYRQHAANLVGSNTSISARSRRVVALLMKKYRHWHDVNIAALRAKQALLTAENNNVMEEFAMIRVAGNRVSAAFRCRRLGLYRQSWQGNIMLFLGAVLRRI